MSKDGLTIQQAAKDCLRDPTLLARPTDWVNTGQALDIGLRFDNRRLLKVTPLNRTGAISGTEWIDIHPEELINAWETLSLEELAEERDRLLEEEERDQDSRGSQESESPKQQG